MSTAEQLVRCRLKNKSETMSYIVYLLVFSLNIVL